MLLLLAIVGIAAFGAGIAMFFYIAGLVGTILGSIWLFVSLGCFILRDYWAYRRTMRDKQRPYRRRP